VENVVLEPLAVFENVVDDAADEDNVRSGAQGYPDVCGCRRARKTRIDVDDVASGLASFNHPLETHRVLLSHGGTHDQNCVGVG
jgi:hypothetical protein